MNDNTLKKELCNKLVFENDLEEYDVIKHSYTQQILSGKKKAVEKSDGIMITLTTRGDCYGVVVPDEYLDPLVVGGVGLKKSNNGKQFYQQDRIYDGNRVSPCIPANLPGGSYYYLLGDEKVKEIFDSLIEEKDGRLFFKNGDEILGITPNKLIKIRKPNGEIAYKTNLRIRRLTPKECFKLMGVKEEDYERIAKNQSNASLYHLAGDSITTNCLMGLFGSILDIDYESKITDLIEDLRTK